MNHPVAFRRGLTLAAIAALCAAAIAYCFAALAPAARADGPGTGAPWTASLGDSYISGEAGRWAGNTNGSSSNVDALGFGALGGYHQARLAVAANNPEKAKDLLKDAQKKLDAADSSDTKMSVGAPTGYLQQSVRDLLRKIDPNALSASPNALTADQLQELQEQMGSPGGDGKGMSSEKLQELLKQMSKGGPKGPAAPAPPASAP